MIDSIQFFLIAFQSILFSIKIPLTFPILIKISRSVFRISVFKLNVKMSQYDRYNEFENVLNLNKMIIIKILLFIYLI